MLRKSLGILVAILAIALGTTHFYRSYQEGNPKWNLLVLAFGMLFLVYYALFSRGQRPNRKK